MTIQTIRFLAAGETPWDYAISPGTLPGPWGATSDESIATYERETGDKVLSHWLRGDVLWIITDAAVSACA